MSSAISEAPPVWNLVLDYEKAIGGHRVRVRGVFSSEAARSALDEGRGAEYLATGTEVPKGRWVSEDFLHRVDGWCSLVYHRHRSQLGDETAAEELRKLSSDARMLLRGLGGEEMSRAE